ncbi:MAG TPA: GYD domain-containing protein [Thermomicrobiales bacterium]|nr:GYD domain-containing protein [Thermomicrobiales bacterium]
MARYLIQATYTSEARAAFVANPQDRQASVRALADKLAIRIESFDFSLGDYDVVIIAEAPDDVTAVAVALVASAPGHLSAYKTTKLLSNDEMMAAMRKASGVSFSAPTR